MTISKRNTSRQEFADAIGKIHELGSLSRKDADEYGQKALNAFVQFGTGATDQSELASLLDYGSIEGNISDQLIYGFKVRGKDILLSHVLNQLELGEIPPEVSERFPDMEEREWIAAIRLSTVIVEMFTRFATKDDKSVT